MNRQGCDWRGGIKGSGKIVKFHARGKGGRSGQVDRIERFERRREGVAGLERNPEQDWELLEAQTLIEKYSSG